MKLRLTVLALFALAALPSAAMAAVGTPTQDSQALATTVLVNPAYLDSANTGWTQQPVIDNTAVPQVPATTAATVSGPVNGFPTPGANWIYLSNGLPANGYDPTSTSDGEYDNPVPTTDRGNANDVSILKVGLKVPAGGNCVAFDYRVITDEGPTTTNYNEGVLAQIDNSSWTVDPTSKVATAPGNFAAAPDGSPATLFGLGAGMTPGEASETALGNGTPIMHAMSGIAVGAHQLYLSTYDVADNEADTGVEIANLVVGTLSGASCGTLVPSNIFTIGTFATKKGLGALSLTLPGAGTVTVYDSKGPAVTIAKKGKKKKKNKKKVALIKNTTTAVAAEGLTTLKITPSRAGKAVLKKTGKLKVKLAIVFKPTGGTASAPQYKTITIKKPKAKKKKKKH